jgi:hypothetical protein
MKTEIKASIKITNGQLLSKKNMANIVARSTKLTDPWGNSLPSPIGKFHGQPGVHVEWRIKREPEGYIFRSTTGSSGINGHHKTIRSLVLNTLFSSHIKVEFDDLANDEMRDAKGEKQL